MVEQEVRNLFARATTDEVLGASTVDIDGVIRRERRAAWQRRGAGLVAIAAAVAAVVVLAPSLLPGGTGAGPAPGATPSTVSPSPLPSSWQERSAIAGQALAEYFPGILIQTPDEANRWDGRVRADGERTDGLAKIQVWAAAARYQGPTGPEVNQCGGASDCQSFPLPDGTVAWLSRIAESGSTINQVVLVRHDGTEVQVGVVYSGSAPPIVYPDETLLRAVTDYRFAAMPLGAN